MLIWIGAPTLLALLLATALMVRSESFTRKADLRESLYALVYDSQLPQNQREQKIKNMGPTAVPLLIQIIDAPLPRTKSWRMRLKSQLTNKHMTEERYRAAAAQACGILRQDSESAVPALARMFERHESWPEVGVALVKIGPAGIAVLTNALSGQEVGVRQFIADILKWGRLAPDAAGDALLRALNDPDAVVRKNAAWSLGVLRARTDQAVTALVWALGDSNPAVRETAGNALGEFGSEARAAVPHLTSFILTNKPAQAGNVKRSLQRIDPTAAAQFR